MNALRRALNALYIAGGVAGALATVGIAAAIFGQVAMREMGRPLPGADDFTGFMVAASALLPLAYTFRHGGHIRVDLIIGRTTGGARRAMEVVALTLGAAMAIFIAWAVADLASDSFAFDDVAQGTVPFKLWIPQTAIAAGCIIFAVSLLDDLCVVLTGGTPSYTRHSGVSAVERAAEEI